MSAATMLVLKSLTKTGISGPRLTNGTGAWIHTAEQKALIGYLDRIWETAHETALVYKAEHEHLISGSFDFDQIRITYVNGYVPKDSYLRVSLDSEFTNTIMCSGGPIQAWNSVSLDFLDAPRDRLRLRIEVMVPGLLRDTPVGVFETALAAPVDGAVDLVEGEVLAPGLPGRQGSPRGTLVTRLTYRALPTTTERLDQLRYHTSERLPVLDPAVPFPQIAKPTPYYTEHDDAMQKAMAAIAIHWTLFGKEETLAVVPQPLDTRSAFADTDYFFADRRINGSTPNFITRHVRSDAEPWDYHIVWDMHYFFDNNGKEKNLRRDVVWPRYLAARFVDVNGELTPHSIYYRLDDPEGRAAEHTFHPGDEGWQDAKTFYRYCEINIRFTYCHVGVHFNVEQYAMALYRRVRPANPLWELLAPHFIDIISNDRIVVRPAPVYANHGIVSVIGALTLDGQYELLRQRFASDEFTWRWKPTHRVDTVAPENIFDSSAITFYEIAEQYVGEYIDAHREGILEHWDEMRGFSEDLANQAHTTANPDLMAMHYLDGTDEEKLTELKQMCAYIVWQAVFAHDYIHWNGFDEYTQALYFWDSPALPVPGGGRGPQSPANAAAEDRSLMSLAFVTWTSVFLKQWPLLDPDPSLGAPPRLRELVRANMPQLVRGFWGTGGVGGFIMAPNT